MRKFKFTTLQILHNDMKKKNEYRATFPFQYNSKDFSCIFLTDTTPYRLYLTTLGSVPLVFEFEIDQEYLVNCFIQRDVYTSLVQYLELKYNPNHVFAPEDFFTHLNKKIPTVFKQGPRYTDVIRVASKCRKVEEADKIFFCGWKRNPGNKSVRPENYEKTKSAFGDEKANMSKEKNISSCWTKKVTEEVLRKLNEINTM